MRIFAAGAADKTGSEHPAQPQIPLRCRAQHCLPRCLSTCAQPFRAELC